MSQSHEPPASREAMAPPRVVEVADGVFAYVQPDGSWWLNNTGFVAGGGVVIAVDTCATEARTRAYLEAVEARVGAPPAVLVNTHHHGDHTNGNCLLLGATIVGHEDCRRLILESGIPDVAGIWEPVEWGELSPAPPFVTFGDRLDLHAGEVLVELHHFGMAAHTTNDVIAWLPERRVLFSGDLLFNGGTPFVLMGSVAGSIAALDRLAELDPEVIVPGHGEPCGTEVIAVVGEYLRFVQQTAAEAKDAGVTPLHAARQVDLGPFAELTGPERIVGNLHRAYAELDGGHPGAPLDLRAPIADMIAFNGGRPLRCLA
jgi:cyclase